MKRLTTIGVYVFVLFVWTCLVVGLGGGKASQDIEDQIRRIAEQVVEDHNSSGFAHSTGVAGPCSQAHDHY